MTREFEYRVCNAQNNRVTFVDGAWVGSVDPAVDDPNEALASCPTTWDFLQAAGAEGWELVSSVSQPVDDIHMLTLFLKRER
jgi:hypothetical protein